MLAHQSLPAASIQRDAAFFLLCVLLLLPSIWSPCSITGQDEYFLSFRTVFEMQERGEWLTPYVNGAVRLQKPPLLYWLMRCSYLVFGGNLFAARIGTVLFGATLALFTAKLARRYRGNGYLAGLLIASCAGVMIEARRAMFDLPVACLSTIAIYYSVAWHANGRLRSALLAALALALGVLTKGPIALWFFAAAVLAAIAVRRSRPAASLAHWLPAFLLFLSIALPWPLWVAQEHPEFWQVLGEEAEARRLAWPEAKRIPELLAALLGLMVPWSVMAIAATVSSLQNRQSQSSPSRWLLTWVVLALLPFAFLKTFERYLLALLCPLAILTDHWLHNASAATQRLQLTIAVSVVAIPVLAFAAFAAWFGFSYLLPAAAIVLLVMTMRCARRREPKLMQTTALVAVLLTVLIGGIYPALGINQLPDDLPLDLATSEVRTFARPQPGMLSMRLQRSVQQFDGQPDGLADRLLRYHGYLFALAEDCERIEAAAKVHQLDIERVCSFRSFYSRKAWLKFFREGITNDDKLDALARRSPTALQPLFVCYRLP